MMLAVALGIVCSLLFTELSGLLAGGLISAGYMAFSIHTPLRLGVTLLAALLTHGLLTLWARFFLLYGRRRFALAVICGYALGWLCSLVLSDMVTADVDLRAVGYIIPGLIANDMSRQGLAATLLGLGAATLLTRLALEFARVMGWF